MSQENNNLQKQDDKIKSRMSTDPVFFNTVRMMLVDYVTNNMNHQQIAEKYNFPLSFVKKVALKFNFLKKKTEYEDKILKTVLHKSQKQQTELIAKITQAINVQVNRIIKLQQADENYIISNNQMKDLLASLTIFQKEYRLDNDKPTENNAVQVLVQFENNVPMVTENHINKTILVEQENTSEVKQDIIENDPMTIEDYKDAKEAEDSVSNADLFGVLE